MFCHGRAMQVNLSNLIAAQSFRPAQAQQPQAPAAKTQAGDAKPEFEAFLSAKPHPESASPARTPAGPAMRLGSQLDIKV
jgi:hypothetical protein